MSRMGIRVLRNQGLGRYYPSGPFRGLGAGARSPRTQTTIEPCSWLTITNTASRAVGSGSISTIEARRRPNGRTAVSRSSAR